MFFYGHGSWIFVVILLGTFALRSTAMRRRRGGRRSTSGYGAMFQGGPGAGASGPAGGAGPAGGPGAGASTGWGTARTGIPAGWMPDPSGRHQERYWSGMAWTEHVRTTGAPGTDPPPG